MQLKNKHSKFLFCLLTVILFSVSHAWAMEWVEVKTTQDGNVLSYDKNSVRKINEDTRRLWERIIYADENIRQGVKSTVFIREIECSTNKQRIISVIDYDSDGEKLFSGTDERMPWTTIPKDSTISELKKIVCGQ